jgi:signal recognition particle GTPase
MNVTNLSLVKKFDKHNAVAMGNNNSSEPVEQEKTADKKITDQISEEEARKKTKPQIKILFLGLPGSGKTLIIDKIKKYMEQVQEAKQQENHKFLEIVHFHTLCGMQQLIQAAEILDVGFHGLKMKADQRKKIDELVTDIKESNFIYGTTVVSEELASKMKLVWELKGAKTIFEQRDDPRLALLKDLQHIN